MRGGSHLQGAGGLQVSAGPACPLQSVVRTGESTHGSCVTQFRLRPRAGETYRVRYELWGLDRCTVHCSREVRDRSGATRGVPYTEMTLELAEGTTG